MVPIQKRTLRRGTLVQQVTVVREEPGDVTGDGILVLRHADGSTRRWARRLGGHGSHVTGAELAWLGSPRRAE